MASTAEPSEAESRSASSSARSLDGFFARQIEVPACFPWRRNADNQDDAERMLEQLLQPFIHTMQWGAEMRVLLDDGNLLDVEVSFDMGVTRLILAVKEVTREVFFTDIKRVSGPEDAEESWTTNSE